LTGKQLAFMLYIYLVQGKKVFLFNSKNKRNVFVAHAYIFFPKTETRVSKLLFEYKKNKQNEVKLFLKNKNEVLVKKIKLKNILQNP
jgi:hypothetical protein